MRQIVLLIVFVLAGRWLVKALRAPHTAEASGAAREGARRASRGAKERSLAEPMVRCAACGVHAPKSESITAGGRYFCCAEHARRHMAGATASR